MGNGRRPGSRFGRRPARKEEEEKKGEGLKCFFVFFSLFMAMLGGCVLK
jgi:hypothetical protein